MRTCISIMCLVGLTSAYHIGDDKVKRLAAVVNDLGQIFHKNLLFLDLNGMFSALSIHSAWTNMWLGSGGSTYDNIYNFSELYRWTGGRNKPPEAYYLLLQEYRSDDGTNGNVTFANYMSVNHGNPVIPKFIDSTRSYFLSEVDYHSSSDPEKKINDYVKNKTNGFITDVINKTGSINSTTQIVYVSTLHVAARWKEPFDKSKTVKQNFYPTGGFPPIKVDMIQDVREIKLKQIDGAMIGQLPCQGDRYAVYFVLPDLTFPDTALAEQEQKLTNANYTDIFINGFTTTLVNFKMPKIHIESTFEMNSVLKKMGLVKPFDATQANFGNFSEISGAYVKTHIHKGVLDLNENGTAPISAAPHQPSTQTQFPFDDFELDHPFLIFVRDKLWNLILLQGKCTGKSGK
ncbi:hypothetical protein BsWGS_21475 [Bradybaena similaris]